MTEIIRRIFFLIILFSCNITVMGQGIQPAANALQILLLSEKTAPLPHATVELFEQGKLVRTAITDQSGQAAFPDLKAGEYVIMASLKGYARLSTAPYRYAVTDTVVKLVMKPVSTTLQEVSVSGRKAFIQQKQGKVIVNVDAAVTNTGTSVLEVLEKSPGVMVDRNGGIVLQGKAGVLVLIDDKPTYLSGTELNNLLSSMSSSQVEQIELMANPPARYDASGNAGIINIKTKKNKVKGFNGTITVSGAQGFYPKSNNSLVMNYRNGRINTFFTYSMNGNKYMTDMYALRKYYDDHGKLSAVLDQPTLFAGTVFNHTAKAGIDYFATDKTTVGLVLGGTLIRRKGDNEADATWLNASGAVDSAIATTSSTNNRFRSGSVNLNARHTLSSRQDISLDLDWLSYRIANAQSFNSSLQALGGYNEASKGDIPSTIQILSGKIDHTLRFGRNSTWMTGWKSSRITTDNLAEYQFYDGIQWSPDYGKSNHFLYRENIHAFYSSLETRYKRLSLQGGLRYEFTGYRAHQLGNVIQKDSAFSRNYDGLFPSGSISLEADSSHTITLTVGRRIDRPAFQKLNPFTFIINKYTYQTGNPYFLPQYSWNFELSHQYKNRLTTTVSYSVIKNYFSQMFFADTAKGILFYSDGNVGKAINLGMAVSLSISPAKWWSLTAQANFNHKQLRGFNGSSRFNSDVNQLSVNLSNQFTLLKKYTAELSGFYITRARNDIQEILYPTGQVSFGVSRPVLKKKGTIKFSARDIFYTTAMEGFTQFDRATEYFILKRDSRVFSLAFTWRFGKAYKSTRRNGGSVGDEIERVGNGG